MGLLGEGWDDPRSMATMQLAAGLLGGGNFGQALGRGLSGYQQAISSAQDAADRKQMASLRAMQIEQARQKIQDEQDLKTLAQQYYKQPTMTTEQVFAAPGAVGPTAARAELIPNTQGEFDAKGFINAYAQKNPLAAMEMKAKLAKEVPINKLDVKDFTPASVQKFAQTGNYGDLVRLDKLHFADLGGSTKGLNPFTGAEVSSTEKTGNPFSDLLVMGPNGQLTVNQPLVSAKSAISRAGATNVNNTVSVAGPENQYNKDIGAGLAKEGLALVDVAKAAPEVVRNAQMIRSALSNGAYTGTGAETRYAIDKALATAGLTGEGRAANTEALISGLSKVTLAGVKTSGLGAGNGFTDKDREFLESAASGRITMTAANIKRVADLSERVAASNYSKGSKVLQRWQSDPALKAVSQDTVLDPLPASTQPSVVRTPVKTGMYGGKRVYQYADGSIEYAN